MTPEKLNEIEAKAQELYPTPTKETYPEPGELAYEKTECFLLRTGYVEGALSRQPELDTLQKENDQLRERVREISILLHDLTPGGSEFANDPEYCAKWIRQSRLEESKSLKQIIAHEKKRVRELEDGEKVVSVFLKALSDGLFYISPNGQQKARQLLTKPDSTGVGEKEG